MAGSVGLWAAVPSNFPMLWPVAFNLWLVRRTCLQSLGNCRPTGVRHKLFSSMSEKRAWRDTRWKSQTRKKSNDQHLWWEVWDSNSTRHNILSLIRSQMRRSCGACWGLCSLTGWWGSICGWTGSCCCWTGLCQWRTATPRGTEYTCWVLTWDRHIGQFLWPGCWSEFF